MDRPSPTPSAAPPPAKERLIETTRQLLWDRGYLGTSPTAIQRRSGVGQGSMYHHFSGKPELALAAEQRSAQLMQSQIREVFSGSGSALEKIVAYLLLERDVLRGCSVGRLAGDPDVIADDALRTPVQETFEVLLHYLTEAVSEAQAAGELARTCGRSRPPPPWPPSSRAATPSHAPNSPRRPSTAPSRAPWTCSASSGTTTRSPTAPSPDVPHPAPSGRTTDPPPAVA